MEKKFLCDQMLAHLGRWLRAAGYDTVIIDKSLPDREILKKALEEKRVIVTRDRHFFEMKSSQKVIIWLKANHLEECVKELSQTSSINWLKKPFSRCLLCNQKLIKVEKTVILDRLPETVQKKRLFWLCASCQKIYWKGSHTKKMLKKLTSWQKIND